MVPFNIPLVLGNEIENVKAALAAPNSLEGLGGQFTKSCIEWIGRETQSKVFLTASGTSALEFAAILINIGPGDEVIVPSYTYVSTINAFLMRGATIVYIDINPDTMNIDANLIGAAITSKTRAIVPVHYGGVSCDMEFIMAIARQHGILVIEDAAHSLSATHNGAPLGSVGHIGCFSFHATKNYTSGGQGGAVMVNDSGMHARADIVFENGTNRRSFLRGEVVRYEWEDLGSNFQMSEIAAACLWSQISQISTVNHRRLQIWQKYYDALKPLEQENRVELPHVPSYAVHNAHIFWLKLPNRVSRDNFIVDMKAVGVMVAFHYVPLHSLPIGKRTGRFSGMDEHTTTDSGRLVRLPLYYALSDKEQDEIISRVVRFVS